MCISDKGKTAMNTNHKHERIL